MQISHLMCKLFHHDCQFMCKLFLIVLTCCVNFFCFWSHREQTLLKLLHLLCKLCANIFCALHTREQTQCKVYFCCTARPRLRLPRTSPPCSRHGEGLHSAHLLAASPAGGVPGDRDGSAASPWRRRPAPARGDGRLGSTGQSTPRTAGPAPPARTCPIPLTPPSPPTPAPCGTCRQGVGTPPSLPPVRSFAGIGEFFSVQGRHVHIPAPKICSMKFCGRSYKHSTFVCSGL